MLNWIDQRVPVRFIAFFAVVALWVLSALQLVVGQASLWVVLCLTGLVGLGVILTLAAKAYKSIREKNK